VFAEILWLLLALLSLCTIGLGIVLLRSGGDSGDPPVEVESRQYSESPDAPSDSQTAGSATTPGANPAATPPNPPPWQTGEQQAGYTLFNMSHEERARLLADAGGWAPADVDEEPPPRPVVARAAIGAGPPSTVGLSRQIRGYVRDSGGAVITGASLTLIDVAGGQIGRKVTGGDGSYSLSTPGPGSYFLITRAKGHHPLASTVTVTSEPVTLGIVLTGLAELSGAVRVVSGHEAVPGAVLTLLDLRGEVVAATTSDARGRYHFLDLVGGTYTLAVSAAPFQPTARLVTVAESGASAQDVELFAGTFMSGTARGGKERRTVPDARVVLTDPDGNVVSVTRTDAAGEYVFLDVPEGSYTLTASGYPPVIATIRVASGEPYQHDLELRHPDD
jgi:hypothetical protein